MFKLYIYKVYHIVPCITHLLVHHYITCFYLFLLVIITHFSCFIAHFPSSDIAKQMPMEAKKFAKIDKEWAKVMGKAFDTQFVVESAANEILRAVRF